MKLDDYLPLAEKLAWRTCSDEELATVIEFLKRADRADAEAFLDEYARVLESVEADLSEFEDLVPIDEERLRRSSKAPRAPISFSRVRKRERRARRWFRYAAAVVAIAGVSFLLKTGVFNNPQTEEHSFVADTLPIEIPPAGNKATLTLSNGDVIVLDSASDGHLAVQQGARIVKEDGTIIYSDAESGGDVVSYNTMSTPKGGQYSLTLADGTRAWLNAASTITYPTAFDDQERVVTVTGEVYFEVARRSSRPFIVEAGTDRITVLGTMFNIRAYSEEGAVKTSLVEGSVRINSRVLKPGQAYVAGDVVETNVEQDLAWRNGYFNFHGMDLGMVMREIARWYDVHVVYPDGIPAFEFGGELQRNLDLSQVLKALERSNVRFRIEGDLADERKTIVVLN